MNKTNPRLDDCACGSCAAASGSHTHTAEDIHQCGGEAHEEAGCGCGHGAKSKPDERRGAIIAIVLSIAAGISGMLLPEGLPRNALLIAAILIAGMPIFWQGLKNIVRLNLEELALLTIAVTAACVIGEYPEALLVTLLFRAGELLEEIAVARSRREVEAITRIIPDNANLILADGSSRQIGAEELTAGNRILIKSGERVPADGIVLTGESSLDTSSLTGESVPREVSAGDTVLSGAVNLGGVLTVETTSGFEDSTAARIIEMVRGASARKGRTERMISRFSRVYTPIVIAAAVLVALLPPLLNLGTFTQWISRSLVFLVASCPCALVISVPLSYFAGIAAASRQGILIKGSRYMEALAGADCVVFDKTGTLTDGRLSVSAVTAAEGVSREELLRVAAACESYSNHPAARAVVNEYGTPDTSDVSGVEEITAHGISALFGGERVLCGSARLMERFAVDISALPAANVYVALGGRALGAIELLDRPRADAKDTVDALRRIGVSQMVMLTGDDRAAAEKTASMTGIDRVEAGLLPQDKVDMLEALRAATPGRTLFVGDGVNDAPVLAMADAGVAMGLGSDSAIEAADVVLLSDRLSSLPQAIRIARRTGRLARFNIAFALTVKLIVLALAFFGEAAMWMAVFADVGVSILAVLNGARALRFR